MLFGNFSNNESRSVSIKSSSKKTITGSDMESFTHNVEVNGTVTKVDGNLPAGKIEVELPTAISFTVDQDGNIPTVNYVVNNTARLLKNNCSPFVIFVVPTVSVSVYLFPSLS